MLQPILTASIMGTPISQMIGSSSLRQECRKTMVLDVMRISVVQGFKNLFLTMFTFNSTSIRRVCLLDAQFGLANALPTKGFYAQWGFRLTNPRRFVTQLARKLRWSSNEQCKRMEHS